MHDVFPNKRDWVGLDPGVESVNITAADSSEWPSMAWYMIAVFWNDYEAIHDHQEKCTM